MIYTMQRVPTVLLIPSHQPFTIGEPHCLLSDYLVEQIDNHIWKTTSVELQVTFINMTMTINFSFLWKKEIVYNQRLTEIPGKLG